MAGTNNYATLVSSFVEGQLPQFVREENPNFVAFCQAYYEFLEQYIADIGSGQPVERAENWLDYIDIDKTVDAFAQKFYTDFLSLIPPSIQMDRKKLLKHALEFYRSRGTEKSVRFLFRALFGQEMNFYYPKDDILRVSSGTWFIQQSLRITNVILDGVANNSLGGLNQFVGHVITGNVSLATAGVESVSTYFENGNRIDELFISGIAGTFLNSETITQSFTDSSNVAHIYTAQIQGGIIASIQVIVPGHNYKIGDPVLIQGGTGFGAAASVDRVSLGNIANLQIIYGGAGFRVNDALVFSASGGANGWVSAVDASGNVHPNTYTFVSDLVIPYANTLLDAPAYDFPNFLNANANTLLVNAFSAFVFAPTGPVTGVILDSSGNQYVTIPNIGINSNVQVRSFGVLGRMEIRAGGLSYNVGDTIAFVNGPRSFGTGAEANVTNVAANGMIQAVYWVPVTGFPIGGLGFNETALPNTTVNTAIGHGANIQVTATLGSGAQFTANTTAIGTILHIRVDSGGQLYNPTNPPVINLTLSGDGTAQAVATIAAGVYSYPGRFLDDTGFPSSFNFLEDQDYYQNYSYVLQVQESITNYRDVLKSLIHPAGTKLFGEYRFTSNIVSSITALDANIRLDYSPLAANFDGGDDFLISANVNLNWNTNQGLVSFWTEPNTVPQGSNTQTIIDLVSGNTDLLQIVLANSGSNLSIIMTGGPSNLNIQTNVLAANVISVNRWNHWITSWNIANLSAPVITMYLNNVSVLQINTNANAQENLSSTTQVTIGANSSYNNYYSGCLTEVYFGNNYIDLSNTQNRFLFRNAWGMPTSNLSSLPNTVLYLSGTGMLNLTDIDIVPNVVPGTYQITETGTQLITETGIFRVTESSLMSFSFNQFPANTFFANDVVYPCYNSPSDIT